MKQILFAALAAFPLFVSCEDDDTKVLANESPIYINGVDNTAKAATTQQRLTVHEILVQKDVLGLKAEEILNGEIREFNYGFEKEMNTIDTINDRLVMAAMNVLPDGQLLPLGGSFLTSRNFYICALNRDKTDFDTLAYIPNSVIREGQKVILDLWVKGDIPEIYRRFNDLFFFTPCTGEEFKAIKEPIDWEHEFDNIPEHEFTHQIRW